MPHLPIPSLPWLQAVWSSQQNNLSPSHLILIAECATRVPNVSLAQATIDRLLILQLPPSDLLCRMLCVQAWVKASITSHIQGAEGVNCLLQAVNYLVQALDVVALLPPQDQSDFSPHHLVYNVSVVYWNITRRMVRTHYTTLVIAVANFP